MNYTDILEKKMSELDESFYELLVEDAQNDADFLLECIENAVILEAEEANANEKKAGWFKKIREIIKSIFDKFIANNTKMIEAQTKWITENEGKLNSISFDGLSGNILVMDGNAAKNVSDIPKSTLMMVDSNISESDLAKLKSKEDVENYKEFGKLKINGKEFKDSVMIRMMGGTNEFPQPKVLEGNELKTYCMGTMLPFVKSYPATVKNIRASVQSFDAKLKNIENELKRRGVSLESYSIIEECYYKDSDIRFCCNYDIVREAEEAAKDDNKDNNSNDSNNKPIKPEDLKTNQVVNTNKDAAGSSSSNDLLKYLRWSTQLHQTVLTTSLSVLEKYYVNSFQTLRNIIKAAK